VSPSASGHVPTMAPRSGAASPSRLSPSRLMSPQQSSQWMPAAFGHVPAGGTTVIGDGGMVYVLSPHAAQTGHRDGGTSGVRLPSLHSPMRVGADMTSVSPRLRLSPEAVDKLSRPMSGPRPSRSKSESVRAPSRGVAHGEVAGGRSGRGGRGPDIGHDSRGTDNGKRRSTSRRRHRHEDGDGHSGAEKQV
jgi:hypothetical protein